MQDLEKALAGMRAQLERIEARLQPQPTAVSMSEAARMLSVSQRHLRRMAQRGELRLSDIGGAKRVALAEVQRLLALAPRPARASRKRERSPATEAQAIRALVKRRR